MVKLLGTTCRVLLIVLAAILFFSSPVEVSCLEPKSSDFGAKTVQDESSADEVRKLRTDQKSKPVIEITSEAILKKVADTYARCTSYTDSGVSRTESPTDGILREISRREFRISFRRKKSKYNYRMAYRVSHFGGDYSKPTILLSDNRRTRVLYSTSNHFVLEDSLEIASAKLTGISSGIAHNIPALLMADKIGGRAILDVTDLNRPVVEELGRKGCYRLEGLFAGDRIKFWIDRESFVILKMVQYLDLERVVNERTSLFSPRLNEQLPDELFQNTIAGEWNSLQATKVDAGSSDDKKKERLNESLGIQEKSDGKEQGVCCIYTTRRVQESIPHSVLWHRACSAISPFYSYRLAVLRYRARNQNVEWWNCSSRTQIP